MGLILMTPAMSSMATLMTSASTIALFRAKRSRSWPRRLESR